jgi:RHS repeat-associated protein
MGTVTSPQTNTNLTFDGCGNQKSLNGGGTFAVDYLNEYTTFNGLPLSSDNDGDVLTYNGWTYTYDAQNRLTTAMLNGTTIASFYYDGLNRQIARSINGLITFSVWDGDWAVLEEYGTSNTVTQKYLEGYHGLVKTLQDNIYYYQDELGSTSHIANSSGALLEYYKYNLYGKPTYWSAVNSQIATSNYNVRDLGNGGARWIPELALYDDRNRFMSPTLGRFIQPDPIGFKGDASNLYRYVGNDWANKTDPMGLVALASGEVNVVDPKEMRALRSEDNRGDLKEYAMINVQRIQVRTLQDLNMGFTMGQVRVEQSSQQQGGVPARYESVRNAKGEQVVEGFTPTQKKFPFQLEDANRNPFHSSELKNQETLIYSNAPRQYTRTSSEKLLSTKGILTDTVGPPTRLGPGVNETRINQFSEKVLWYGTPYSIPTQIRQETVIEHGVPVRISATTIEPGQPGYINPR